MLVVVNDRRDLYPEILERSGLRLVERLERHVNRRTGRRAGEYFESVLVALSETVNGGLPVAGNRSTVTLGHDPREGDTMRKLLAGGRRRQWWSPASPFSSHSEGRAARP